VPLTQHLDFLFIFLFVVEAMSGGENVWCSETPSFLTTYLALAHVCRVVLQLE